MAVICQERLKCTDNSNEEEDCELVNMDINNAGCKTLGKSAVQMIYEERKAFKLFVRAKGNTQ